MKVQEMKYSQKFNVSHKSDDERTESSYILPCPRKIRGTTVRQRETLQVI